MVLLGPISWTLLNLELTKCSNTQLDVFVIKASLRGCERFMEDEKEAMVMQSLPLCKELELRHTVSQLTQVECLSSD